MADILRDYTLKFEVRVESTLRDLRECLTKAIKDRDCCRELLDATMEDYDEMGRAYKADLATLKVELEQRSLAPLGTKAECIQLRSRVTSLESELADLTQRFTILGQTGDEERAIVEANHAKVSSKADDLALWLLETRSFILSTLSLEYGSTDEPSGPQLAFPCLQAELAKKEEALRVATTKVGTLQALLDTERQGCTSSPSMEFVFDIHMTNLRRLPEIWTLM